MKKSKNGSGPDGYKVLLNTEALAPDSRALIALTLNSLSPPSILLRHKLIIQKGNFYSFHVIYSLPIPISYGLANMELYS